MGRTQLQDAVPMTLGQEFGTYAVMLGEDRLRLEEAVTLLHWPEAREAVRRLAARLMTSA